MIFKELIMKRILLLILLTGCLAVSLVAQSATPSAAELLRRVDDNEFYKTITYTGEMIIEYQGRRYQKSFQAWARANEDSFIEFTNTEDSGTRYLKRGGRLYVYSPDSEQVMLISGHMLKESMMGSDLSYEDTIENETLSARYTPELIGTAEINGRPAWELRLTAKKATESYPRQTLWIDRENGDMLRAEYYALSGVKLKEYTLLSAREINGRRFPVESEMRDLLRRDSRTVFKMEQVVLDSVIDESTFSLRNLER